MIKLEPKLRRTRRTPIYNIGAASRLTGLPVWRLRWLERQECLRPNRTGGNQRLYSDADVEEALAIAELLAQGVNLAGVRIILKIRRNGGNAP